MQICEFTYSMQRLVSVAQPYTSLCALFSGVASVQLNAVHVRPGHSFVYEGNSGRNMVHFDNLESAFQFMETRQVEDSLFLFHP